MDQLEYVLLGKNCTCSVTVRAGSLQEAILAAEARDPDFTYSCVKEVRKPGFTHTKGPYRSSNECFRRRESP